MIGPQKYDPSKSILKVDGEVMGEAKPLEATMDASKQPTKKQQEKEQKQLQAYWNSMITRRQAYQMVQEAVASMGQMSQQLQLLMIQNRTLLEMLSEKGIATEEEINEHSKKVMESIFGPMPEDLLKAEQEVATGDADA